MLACCLMCVGTSTAPITRPQHTELELHFAIYKHMAVQFETPFTIVVAYRHSVFIPQGRQLCSKLQWSHTRQHLTLYLRTLSRHNTLILNLVRLWIHRHNNWAASPNGKGRATHKARRVNLMEEGGYEPVASSGNGRRIRKPLNSDFVYYSNAAGGLALLCYHCVAS